MTFLLEVHRWRGFARWSDGLWKCAQLGWVTVGMSPQSLIQKMRRLVTAMRELAKHEGERVP